MKKTVPQKKTPCITNPFKTVLATGRPLIGAWLSFNSVNVAEAMAWTGYDWLLLDGEHTPVSLKDGLDYLRVLESTPTAPIIRLAWNNKTLIKRYLDIGTRTLMLPYIETPEEAFAAVQEISYPPKGIRGVSSNHRASRYGQIPDYLKNARDNLFLILQIETLKAVENLEKILAVDGVDAVFFGPGDLSANMGNLGEAGGEAVTQLILNSFKKCQIAGKYAGVVAPTPEIAETYLKAGFHFVSVASDYKLLVNKATKIANKFRKISYQLQKQ